jgi:hypothetical protein
VPHHKHMWFDWGSRRHGWFYRMVFCLCSQVLSSDGWVWWRACRRDARRVSATCWVHVPTLRPWWHVWQGWETPRSSCWCQCHGTCPPLPVLFGVCNRNLDPVFVVSLACGTQLAKHHRRSAPCCVSCVLVIAWGELECVCVWLAV